MKYISIIDMEINNLKSIVGAINHFGFKTIITNNQKTILNGSAIILPGVGSFPAGMKKLKKKKLDFVIKKFYKAKKPILAICLGFQLLFTSSTEFKNTKGLNILKGKVQSLKNLKTEQIVPNVGWNVLNYKKNKKNILFKNFKTRPALYFVHSFFVNPESKQIETSTINFGKKKLVSSIQFQNLFGVQFHPEKSGKSGLNIIKNFLEQI